MNENTKAVVVGSVPLTNIKPPQKQAPKQGPKRQAQQKRSDDPRQRQQANSAMIQELTYLKASIKTIKQKERETYAESLRAIDARALKVEQLVHDILSVPSIDYSADHRQEFIRRAGELGIK